MKTLLPFLAGSIITTLMWIVIILATNKFGSNKGWLDPQINVIKYKIKNVFNNKDDEIDNDNKTANPKETTSNSTNPNNTINDNSGNNNGSGNSDNNNGSNNHQENNTNIPKPAKKRDFKEANFQDRQSLIDSLTEKERKILKICLEKLKEHNLSYSKLNFFMEGNVARLQLDINRIVNNDIKIIVTNAWINKKLLNTKIIFFLDVFNKGQYVKSYDADSQNDL